MVGHIEAPGIRFAQFVNELHEPGTAFLSPTRVSQRMHWQIQA